MYVLRNTETRSCINCSGGKATNVTQTECVFVALGIQHKMLIRHIVICGLPRSKTFFHISHKQHDLGRGEGSY